MNKVYDISENVYSNKGIYEAFYAEIVAPSLSREKAAYSWFKKLLKLRQILTCSVARRLLKVAGTTISILGIVGVAGGIQQGKISLLGGITVAAVCLGVEYLCLRSLERNAK